jgi:hypothetical protein
MDGPGLNTNNLLRRLDRLNKEKVKLETRHKGNEQQFTYHGGFDLGYVKGKIHEIENILDDLGVKF